MSEQRVRLRDGAEIWAAVSGTGPPVVLLHGGAGLWDYLGSLADLLTDAFTLIRFDQRGCGRSSPYDGPFTIAQAVDDVDQVRAAFGVGRWAVLGHSWGAELAIRYAAEHPSRTTAVAYVAGIGAGDGFLAGYRAKFRRRLGPDYERWLSLDIPADVRTPEQERECSLLQWGPDYSPSGDPAAHALALWNTKPPGATLNVTANHQLRDADPDGTDLLQAAARVTCPVTMICGADDPRPWTATDSLLGALPDATRIVFDNAGHAPWAERPADTRQAIIDALQPAVGRG